MRIKIQNAVNMIAGVEDMKVNLTKGNVSDSVINKNEAQKAV